ncbi:MAG: CHAD domain-containing protein [Steroidobacteraceae bacterium]
MGERGNHGSLGERSMASNHIYARVRHSAQKDLEAALRLLHASARESFGEGSVHAVRKHVKRVRSLLRIVPRTNGRHRLKRVKSCLREVSNALADLRDAQVLLRAVDGFRADVGISRTTRLKLRALVRTRLRAAVGKHRPADLRRWLAKRLKKASRLLRGWSPTESAEAFRQECRRLYERGRAAMELAVQRPADDDALHQWRKRVKDLLHVYELTLSARHSATRVILSRIRALTQVLGRDHDLAMLQAAVTSNLAHALSTGEPRTIHRVVSTKRRRLQRRAFELGARVYKDP